MQPVRNQVRQLWEKSKAALSRPMPLDEPVGQTGDWLARDAVAMGTLGCVSMACGRATRRHSAGKVQAAAAVDDDRVDALQRLDRRTVDHRVAVCSRDLDGRHDEDAIALRVPDRALNVADRVVV